jgi:hypothetical protein
MQVPLTFAPHMDVAVRNPRQDVTVGRKRHAQDKLGLVMFLKHKITDQKCNQKKKHHTKKNKKNLPTKKNTKKKKKKKKRRKYHHTESTLKLKKSFVSQ